MLNITFQEAESDDNGAIAVLVNDQLRIDKDTVLLDQHYNNAISKIIQNPLQFKGTLGQSMAIIATSKTGKTRLIIIIGIGNEKILQEYQIEEIGGKIYGTALASKSQSVSIKLGSKLGDFKPSEGASLIASGAMLASYRFDKYFTKKTEEEKFFTANFNIIIEDPKVAEELFADRKAVTTAVFFTRDCISEAPNILFPESFAERIVDILDPLGVDIEVLGEREMRELGMGALLGVGQGSEKESKVVIMKYQGGPKDQDPVCFVGKGVTFDTGGISLKPAAGMEDMKYDMAGSAAVVGTIFALAQRGAKVNVVGVIGLVENMPGGNAQRPSDIVTTMSGQTVEVLNTDAEGRLVLADCMTYLQENFKPSCIVDLATLTGAIVVALGNSYGGCFANDDKLAQDLINASLKTNEKLWRMPLHKDYNTMLKSSVADIANIGGERGAAGSSTAAHFIGRFIKDGVKWAHLDIAGMAWDKKGTNPICPRGAVGFGVRLLNKFVKDNYE